MHRSSLDVVVITPEERAARAAAERLEAERRLRAAEKRLRDAILEIEQRQGHLRFLQARHPLCKHGDSCLANAVGGLVQSFMLAYTVRVGIGVLLRAFTLTRNRSILSILDLQLLLGEKNLMIREEACRTGLLFGGFAGLYHGVGCALRRLRGKDTPLNEAIAGAMGGLSVLALEDRSKRRTFALYLLARVAQCAYNSAKTRFHWVGDQLWHGDVLLFALSSAQIMYAYVMRPETLPESYWQFIVRTGPIAPPVLKAVRETCQHQRIDVASLSSFVRSQTGRLSPLEISPISRIIPCSVLHPTQGSCLRHNIGSWQGTFKKTFPYYLSLTFVPFVVLNVEKFLGSPFRTVWLAGISAVRSTAFLSTFVATYMGFVCVQRRLVAQDHKFTYWLAGATAGLSVLLEKKNRRGELALYAAPRAADSLWYILIRRHFLPDIKYAEVAMFSACMGLIMYFHEHEPDTMAPFLRGLISRFLVRPAADQPGSPDVSPMLSERTGGGWEQHLQTQTQQQQQRPSVVQRPGGGQAGRGGTGTGRGLLRDTSKPVVRRVQDPQQAAELLRTEAFQGL